MAQERSRFRTVLLAGAVTVLGLGAIGTVGAVQAQGFFNEVRGGPGFSGPMAGFMVDRALASVDATDEQREEIGAIVEKATADIHTMVSDLDDPKEQFTTLLAAETLDRVAFEALRQQTLETGDAVSIRALEAFLDAADVLTPAQRAELIEQGKGFGPGFGRGFGPGRH